MCSLEGEKKKLQNSSNKHKRYKVKVKKVKAFSSFLSSARLCHNLKLKL